MSKRKRKWIGHPTPGNPPPVYRKYNYGHYTMITPGQPANAQGQDSGTVQLNNYGLISYADSGVPGGHTRTSGPWTTTSGPVVGTVNGSGAIVAGSGSRGIVMPYTWAELETAKGVYDLTRMTADLAVCKYLNIQMIVLILVRSFNPSLIYMPGDHSGVTDNDRYLNQLPYDTPFTAGQGSGHQGARWNNSGQNVRTRFLKLCQQIGTRFDADPNFEGVATQETSCGMSAAEQAATAYDPDDFLAGLNAEHDSINSACPTSRHFAFHNFMPGSGSNAKLDAYCDYVMTNDGVFGGPDILPDASDGLQGTVYPRYDRVYGNDHPHDGPTFCSYEPNSYNTIHTMQALCNWVSNRGPLIGGRHLKIDYQFWYLKTGGDTTYAFDPDARLVITDPTNQNIQTYSYPP